MLQLPDTFQLSVLRTPSSSLESNDAGNGGVNAVEVPDYPRPRSPNSAKVNATASEPAPTAEEAAAANQQDSNGGSGGNRQERRRQERKREKGHRDGEDTNNNNNNNVLSSHNDAMFNHLNKRINDRNMRNDPMGGSKGVRITQPAGKFMV